MYLRRSDSVLMAGSDLGAEIVDYFKRTFSVLRRQLDQVDDSNALIKQENSFGPTLSEYARSLNRSVLSWRKNRADAPRSYSSVVLRPA